MIYPDQPELFDSVSYPPLGLLYLGASLKNAKYSPILYNLCLPGTSYNQIPEADIYLFSIVTATYLRCKKIIKIIKEKFKQAKIIVGGVHPTIFPERTLIELNADCVVVGKGEQIIIDILNYYQEHNEIEKNIFYSQLNSVDRFLPDRSLCPDWQIQSKSSVYINKYYPNKFVTSILTSRGCPFHCAYCSKSRITSGFREHNVQSVIEEIKHLISRYNIHQYRILDDVFTLNHERIYQLYQRIREENLEVYFDSILRADSVNEDLLATMYNLGIRNICIGVESGSDKILKKMNKRESIDKIKQSIYWAHCAGITVKVFLIFGLPGETLETIEETKQFMIDTQPDNYTLSTFTPLPGSDLWTNPEKYGIKYNVDINNFKNLWFYWNPEDEDKGWYYPLPLEVKKARGNLIKWLRWKKWKK